MNLPGNPPKSPRRLVLRRILRAAFVVLAVVLLVVAVVRQWPQLLAALSDLSVLAVLGAFACVLCALWSNMLSWRALLAGLGSKLPLRGGARVYFLAQLGKYLPGSIWPVLAQVDLGREYEVPASRSAAAAAINLVLNLVTGSVIGAGALALTSASSLAEYWWILLALPVFLVLLHPKVIGWLVDVAMKVLRRPPVGVRLDFRTLLVATAWSVLMWVALGGHLAVLAYGTGARDGNLLVLATGAYAVSWVVGFLVVIAPAGAGVREVALVVTLGQVLSPSAALAVALVSRVVSTLADLAVALAAVVAERVHRLRVPMPLVNESAALDGQSDSESTAEGRRNAES